VISLRALPRPLRASLSLFLVSAILGFAVGLLLEFRRTGMSRSGLSTHLRGDGEFAPPMELDTLLAITHPHAAMVPLLLLASSLPFLLGRRASDREKTLAVAAAWGGLFLSIGAHWLVRFHGPGWFPAYSAGGILFTVGFLWPSLRALQELWGAREAGAESLFGRP